MSNFILKADAEQMTQEYLSNPSFDCLNEHPMENNLDLDFNMPKERVHNFRVDKANIEAILSHPEATQLVAIPAIKSATNDPNYKHLTFIFASADMNEKIIGMRDIDTDNGIQFVDYSKNCPKNCP